jgi:8-oxo-dGTP diphosphatase
MTADEAEDGQVRAAGGVPWRRRDDGALEVLVVHRPRYDDWSFPKGKLDPGESWQEAALREVREEAAIVAVLGDELTSTQYRDRHGRSKQVRYWAMPVTADEGFAPGDEVDERRWVRAEEAASLLTYDHDRSVLASVLELLAR